MLAAEVDTAGGGGHGIGEGGHLAGSEIGPVAGVEGLLGPGIIGLGLQLALGCGADGFDLGDHAAHGLGGAQAIPIGGEVSARLDEEAGDFVIAFAEALGDDRARHAIGPHGGGELVFLPEGGLGGDEDIGNELISDGLHSLGLKAGETGIKLHAAQGGKRQAAHHPPRAIARSVLADHGGARGVAGNAHDLLAEEQIAFQELGHAHGQLLIAALHRQGLHAQRDLGLGPAIGEFGHQGRDVIGRTAVVGRGIHRQANGGVAQTLAFEKVMQ